MEKVLHMKTAVENGKTFMLIRCPKCGVYGKLSGMHTVNYMYDRVTIFPTIRCGSVQGKDLCDFEEEIVNWKYVISGH